MENLIQLQSPPVQAVLDILLKDQPTKKNIVWATNSYEALGSQYAASKPITLETLAGLEPDMLQPGAMRAVQQRQERTKSYAEVPSPSWLCNRMLNDRDRKWFGRDDVFNRQRGESWEMIKGNILFPKTKTWQEYIDERCLEITCGEAPFLTSRYDAATGRVIHTAGRIGLLDRKLRIASENTDTEKSWLFWAMRALKSVYGYEYQGDNLLIGRINLLASFTDHLSMRWHREAAPDELMQAAHVISWNLWQMDWLTGSTPYGDTDGCLLRGWQEDKRPVPYQSMHFPFVTGNPPYQDETRGNNKGYAPPIYHKFMEAAYKAGGMVELVHPARFLFNAGGTPKQWNRRMLNDPCLEVVYFERDSSNVFDGTSIRGGVAVTCRDTSRVSGPVMVFTPYRELDGILRKVKTHKDFESFSGIVFSRCSYRLTDQMHKDHPEAIRQLSEKHPYDMPTNIFKRLPQIFFKEKPDDGHGYIRILGRTDEGRIYRYVRRDYIIDAPNLDKYKIFTPKADGSGIFGEALSQPILCGPGVGATETFISLGAFDTRTEAEAALKYIKTRFARTLLGVLKTTQDLTPSKWACVPLQDFSRMSDIRWDAPVSEIDKQLYEKYGLSEEEVRFIGSNTERNALAHKKEA